MALKVTFNQELSVKEQMEIAMRVEMDIINSMKQAGEKFVRDARNMSKAAGGFGDVTGNLRSSIGYFILKNGAIIMENLQGTTEGNAAARQLISEISAEGGYKLVGCAAMEYASAVESRGLNVISIQADTAIIDLTKYFKAIENKYRAA